MIELLVLGFVALVALAVVALFAGALSLVCWVVLLPFRLTAMVFKGLGFLLAIPFMLVFGVVGFFIFGFGAVLFLIPLAPFALIAFLLWRWMRGRPRAAVSA